MAQDDRHLTTEQLSAYLDGQVSSAERAQWDSHLQACEQCKQELASLRQTVALLHALPQPTLPRSFVLSPASTMQYMQNAPQDQDEGAAPISLAAQRAARNAAPTRRQRERGSIYLRNALRTLSALAAVAGLLLFLSGVVTGASNGISTASSGTASSASGAMQRPAAQPVSPSAPQPTDADITPQTNASSGTSAASHQPQSTFASNDLTPQLKPAPTEEVRKLLPQTPPALPDLLFFDINVPSTRVGLGMLLVLLGVMGFIVFKQRKSNRSQSQ